MRAWTSSLIAAERSRHPGDTEARAGFRVCDKLRRPLSTLAGAAGFHSLFSRAWVLARAEAPWLAALQIKADGTFHFTSEMETGLGSDEAAAAAAALVNQLLQLLITLIGEALTLRLVQEVWPEAALKQENSGKSRYEKKES